MMRIADGGQQGQGWKEKPVRVVHIIRCDVQHHESGCSMYAEIPIWSYSIVMISPWILPSSRNIR